MITSPYYYIFNILSLIFYLSTWCERFNSSFKVKPCMFCLYVQKFRLHFCKNNLKSFFRLSVFVKKPAERMLYIFFILVLLIIARDNTTVKIINIAVWIISVNNAKNVKIQPAAVIGSPWKKPWFSVILKRASLYPPQIIKMIQKNIPV